MPQVSEPPLCCHLLRYPAQGGSLKEVCKYGLTENVGLLVNSSRGIIYASKDTDFAKAAAQEAKNMQLDMKAILDGVR